MGGLIDNTRKQHHHVGISLTKVVRSGRMRRRCLSVEQNYLVLTGRHVDKMPLIDIIDVVAGNDASDEFNVVKKKLKYDNAEIHRRIPSDRCCVLRTKARTYSLVLPILTETEQTTTTFGSDNKTTASSSSGGARRPSSSVIGVDGLCAAVDVLIGRHGPMIWKTAMETTDNIFEHSTYY
eukprot:GHVS01072161.1.p1 GENE.GHVS01072161.1~~GHVS01072161.1.p1  ORF type:complete len:180 (+),score=38.44 GHVS01072161.1:520-1059(+)